MNKQPTIKEIANRLCVSSSTVSRALKDNPRIGLAMREKVKKLASELNFEPNTQAIYFKQKRTHVIGVVLPFIREEFFSQAISGIEEVASENDFTILFGQSYDELEKEMKVVEAMKRQRVDGLLISLSKETNKYCHLDAFKNKGIPVVFFDRVPSIPEVHKVYCNIYKGTVEMINWLFNKGYKRIAFINGPDKLIASRERLKGFVEAISKHKLKVDMQLVEKTDFSKESTELAMEKLLALKKRPQAIISFNDYVHMDAVQYASKHHIAVNKDLVFVSYANLPITSYTAFPPLASIEQYPYRQGEKAMEILMSILNKNDTEEASKDIYYAEELSPSLVVHQQVIS
jgi:DNA-binding LacI/PurR family transcriptional regulator